MGLLIPPGTDYVGELKVIDISIPRRLIEGERIQTHLLEEEEIRKGLAIPRRRDSHKGDYGHLLVLAGSVGKTGAAAMACEAALRMGAGLVTLGIPKSLNAIMEVKLTEVMTEPLPETAKQTLSLRAFNAILRLCENKKAVVIGPGIGTFKETQTLVLKLIRTLESSHDPRCRWAHSPRSADSNPFLRSKRPLILTPHPGEMGRLTGLTSKQVLEDRIGISRSFSQSHQVYLVLKGYRTLIATPQGESLHQPNRKSREWLLAEQEMS